MDPPRRGQQGLPRLPCRVSGQASGNGRASGPRSWRTSRPDFAAAAHQLVIGSKPSSWSAHIASPYFGGANEPIPVSGGHPIPRPRPEADEPEGCAQPQCPRAAIIRVSRHGGADQLVVRQLFPRRTSETRRPWGLPDSARWLELSTQGLFRDAAVGAADRRHCIAAAHSMCPS